ncbi:MAG: hypothetical protein IJ091_03430 [Oscillospiraceae bacterium]|nr:hypothetical protein [Oscillospiraceae bacterium]
MFESFLSGILEYTLIALGAATLQNLLLTRMVGGDHIARQGSSLDERIFCISQMVCTLLSSAGFWIVHRFLLPQVSLLERFGISHYYARAYLWPFCASLVCGLLYFVLYTFASELLPSSLSKKVRRQLPYACFNSFVCAVLFRIAANDFSFFRMVAFALGSSIGYSVADLLIWEGKRKMAEADLPEAFRGLPSTLLYIAGLALAFYALAGRGVTTLL